MMWLWQLTSVFAFLVLVSQAHPNLSERAASSCSNNVCASALASRTAAAKVDCSSFLQTTVSPCPKTVKSTVTVTSTLGCALTSAPSAPSLAPATVGQCPSTQTPSALPSYALNVCTNAGAYAAACNCIGAGRTRHVNLPASTVTVTTYTTKKVSPTFLAQVVSGGYQGYYIWDGPYGDYPEFTGDASQADQYYIASNGSLVGVKATAAWQASSENCYGCYNSVTDYPTTDPDNLICKLGTTLTSSGYFSLSCKTPEGATRFQQCAPDGNSLDIGGRPNTDFMDCFVQVLGAFPVCT